MRNGPATSATCILVKAGCTMPWSWTCSVVVSSAGHLRDRNTELTMSALEMALSQRPIVSGCLFHSNQGTEYAALEYRDLVESAGLTRSMSRKGMPKDNAALESYFGTLKSELIHQMQFANQIEATAPIMAYIEFYNRERSHTSTGFQSPQEYERLCA